MQLGELQMNIGDTIISKKLGVMAPSTVCGVLTSEVYIGLLPSHPIEWDELYPDWKEGEVVIAKFNEPVRYISFEDFLKKFEIVDDDVIQEVRDKYPEIYLKLAKKQYLTVVPAIDYVYYPIADVELF